MRCNFMYVGLYSDQAICIWIHLLGFIWGERVDALITTKNELKVQGKISRFDVQIDIVILCSERVTWDAC